VSNRRAKERVSETAGPLKRAALGLGAAALLAALSGCTGTDSWLLDPSVVGRWEWTPTTVPILTRITSIEGPEDEFVEISEVTTADLIPEVFEYRLGPGDRMIVDVWDLPVEGQPARYERIVDARGYITIPQLGPVFVSGHTVSGAEAVIMDTMRPLVLDPLVSIVVDHQRQLRYSVVGAVQGPGAYVIPVADYRLHEALAAAGGFSEAPEFIYVIRYIPLAEPAGGRPVPMRPPGEEDRAAPRPQPERLIDIIDELARPEERERAPERPAEPLPQQREMEPPAGPRGAPGLMRPRSQPPIDLIDDERRPAREPAAAPRDAADMSWIFVDGQWVRVQRQPQAGPAGLPDEALGRPRRDEPLVTQRVIRVPVNRLVAGDQRVNLIVRPGDIIRVPPPPPGNIYVLGQVNRVGSYAMADKLTLRRIISAAGGFNQIAIPERIDLTRMVGPERQATIRLNGRAIFQGTHPDIFLKSNDEINVGTNFWATPLAVIRNGFRATYGFGFLLDRNFGNDVFGAPPTRVIGQ
jgi:polysaccharide biosynthesis/export protein